jgi:N-acetylmuramic acid 6-phosphate (MurNAc-6-P) etherase
MKARARPVAKGRNASVAGRAGRLEFGGAGSGGMTGVADYRRCTGQREVG